MSLSSGVSSSSSRDGRADRKSTRLNSSHSQISYAVFCLKKKNTNIVASHVSILLNRYQSQPTILPTSVAHDTRSLSQTNLTLSVLRSVMFSAAVSIHVRG